MPHQPGTPWAESPWAQRWMGSKPSQLGANVSAVKLQWLRQLAKTTWVLHMGHAVCFPAWMHGCMHEYIYIWVIICLLPCMDACMTWPPIPTCPRCMKLMYIYMYLSRNQNKTPIQRYVEYIYIYILDFIYIYLRSCWLTLSSFTTYNIFCLCIGCKWTGIKIDFEKA